MHIPTLRIEPRNLSRAALLALSLLLVLAGAKPARAQESSAEVEACATAYEQAQVTRNDGKLKKAQEHLAICVRDICPEFVKVDCGQWLSEVKREVPSVIFSAIDSGGSDLTDVKVTIDGEIITESLDGIAIELEPGPHNVEFEFAGKTQKKQLIVRQGEKNRVFRAEFVTSTDSDGDGVNDDVDLCPDTPGVLGQDGCPGKSRGGAGAVPPPNSQGHLLRNVAYGAWALGGVALGTAVVAGLMSKSVESDALKACPKDADGTPQCEDSVKNEYISKLQTRELVANIGFGVGGTAAVVGTVLFFLAPSDAAPTAAGLKFNAAPSAKGGYFSVSGAF